MARETRVERWRVAVVILILAGSAVGLVVRVGYLQLVQRDYFAQMAADEHWVKQEVIPQRGTIQDRNGNVLASTIKVYDVLADPAVLTTPEKKAKAASLLASSTKLPLQQITSGLQRVSDKPYVLLSDLPYEVGERIVEMQLAGIQLMARAKRVYPEGNFAAPLIGFVGRDQRGLTGVEADFNRELMGRLGTLVYERDTTGSEIPLGFRDSTPSQQGADVVLTIDRYIQRLVDRELDQAMKTHRAASAQAIVMDVKTGAILAIANRPGFDLTKLNLDDSSKTALFRLVAVTDMYEPGSIFKVFTMASAMEEKLVTPTTNFNDTGSVEKNGWTIRNWDGSSHGLETMTDILKNSCNVGMVWVSDKLGPDRFYKYMKSFGFGQRTNIELEGEASGLVRTNKSEGWAPLDLAANSFGQGISVTPLQLVTAFGAIANGGKLMRPYVISQVVGPNGTRNYEPVVVRRVLSEATSQALVKMLTVSGEVGTGNKASIPGFRIAGKSGTAQIPLRGAYTGKEATIAGFAGFAPAEDPRIIVLVRVDEPKDSPWGSSVAAPIFKTIMEQSLLYFRVPPTDPSKVGKASW